MQHRLGKRFGGNHTTVIDTAAEIIDMICSREDVTTISPGVLKMNDGHGERRVKITDIRGGLLLTIRQTSSVQEVRVFTNSIHDVKFAIACGARDRGIRIAFGCSE